MVYSWSKNSDFGGYIFILNPWEEIFILKSFLNRMAWLKSGKGLCVWFHPKVSRATLGGLYKISLQVFQGSCTTPIAPCPDDGL